MDLYHVDMAGAAAAGLTPSLPDAYDLHAQRDVTRVQSLPELATVL